MDAGRTTVFSRAASLIRQIPWLPPWARWAFQRLHHRRGVVVEINGTLHRVSAKVARGVPRVVDAPALRFWLDAVRGRNAAIDAGANIGIWSVLAAAQMKPSGVVVAIEPAPAAFDVLADSARVSQAPGRIVPVFGALGDHVGTARLQLDGPLAATNRLVDDTSGDRTVEVPLLTIDDLVSERDFEPAAIKVDVEGAELAVLRGARRTLQNLRPTLIVELHWIGELRQSPERLLDFANDCRYSLYDDGGEAITAVQPLWNRNFIVMRPQVVS